MTIPFHTVDWNHVAETLHAGETGTATWRTLQYGDLRVRLVHYSPGYKADHWCTKGHIVYCIDGEMNSELADGRNFLLTAGMSYHVTDDASSHRSSTPTGATLLIIDGNFLKADPSTPLNPWKM